MPESPAPGLKLTLKSANKTDTRPSRLIALTVPAKTAPSPFLPSGPFTAIWDGTITLRIRGEYTFRAFGSGSIKVLVNDQPALEASGPEMSTAPSSPVKISKGKTKIHVEYTSPTDGDAMVRLYWFEKSAPPEPIAPTLLSHDADVPLRTQNRIRDGRALFAELRCIKCHSVGAPALASAANGMPELSQDAPDLSDAGARFRPSFLATWIANPKSINPRAQMPRLFGDDQQSATDVAAYLASLGSGQSAAAPSGSDEDLAAGARLYSGLGCIACHLPPDFSGNDAITPPRIPHKHITEKYATAAALAAFLKSPHARFKWSRMPNFRLSDSELDLLVKYLYRPTSNATPAPQGDATRGKTLFQSAGCLNCHTVKDIQTTLAPPATLTTSDWSKGCLAADTAARGKAPDFTFTDSQRGALQAFAAAGFDSLSHDIPLEFAQRQVAQLNCTACHARDKSDDTWSLLRPQIEQMLAKLPPEKIDPHSPYFGDQSRPPLTWIGEKLRPQWMEQFIAGNVSYKPRPWLLARMPSFPAQSHGLAAGFAHEHGFPTVASPNPAPDPALAEAGKKLVAKTGGFSCIQCHDAGEMKALSAFEAPAPNFAHTTERLTPEFYMRWVLKPQKVQPGTRMPDFADIEGKTSLKTFYDGDARKQFDAIWNYLLTTPLPPPQ